MTIEIQCYCNDAGIVVDHRKYRNSYNDRSAKDEEKISSLSLLTYV